MKNMKLLFGDIHNHCGITYGFGSLENALARAKSQLDFCAVTGHAMWPDMPERTDETAFVVDFHNKGFKKLYDNWEAVSKTMARENSEDFVTFQAYEMHSGEYGDHHIVSPDDDLKLIYRNSPRELVKDCGCDALTVAHHIGYTPGYRGINWDKFDEKITPLIEVCSKHGCAMNETALYPYYHDMGPRDSRNTVYEGLRRGYHFGFVGSTDHHAGFPGSYADGKMAVWATEKTREAIWQAMLMRRTYAVTADKIKCEFAVNDEPMGSIIKERRDKRTIAFRVEADYSIDKIVIYKNLKPFDITQGLLLQRKKGDKRFKFRIEMGWGNSTELFEWNGSVKTENGSILEVQTCWRGRSILSPTEVVEKTGDSVNAIDDCILLQSAEEARWQCYTARNLSTMHPQTSAVIFEINASDNTVIHIDINGQRRSLTLKELLEYGYSSHIKPYHSHAYKVHTAIAESEYIVDKLLTDEEDDEKAFYHMEVISQNGSCAYVSPVYFEK